MSRSIDRTRDVHFGSCTRSRTDHLASSNDCSIDLHPINYTRPSSDGDTWHNDHLNNALDGHRSRTGFCSSTDRDDTAAQKGVDVLRHAHVRVGNVHMLDLNLSSIDGFELLCEWISLSARTSGTISCLPSPLGYPSFSRIRYGKLQVTLVLVLYEQRAYGFVLESEMRLILMCKQGKEMISYFARLYSILFCSVLIR